MLFFEQLLHLKPSVKTLFRNNLMPFRLCSLSDFVVMSSGSCPFDYFLSVFSAWLKLMYSMLCSLKCLA